MPPESSRSAGLRVDQRRHCTRVVLAVAAVALHISLSANGQPARTHLFDGRDGATCDYYNAGARLAWKHRLGDWHDASGREQGTRPYAQARVSSTDEGRVVRFDVKGLVQSWLDSRLRNDGLLITGVPGGPDGTAQFHSREAADPGMRPRLAVTLAGGVARRIEAVADTTLDCSTYTSLGSRPVLAASTERRVLVQFDLGGLDASRIVEAVLELVVTRSYGTSVLGVHALEAPLVDPRSPGTVREGLAARFVRDEGIEAHPAVIMATGFDSVTWASAWTHVSPRNSARRVDQAPSLGFQPLSGHALQVRIPSGQHLALDLGYQFARTGRDEPEEVYFRYYLRLASDWRPTADGGKLPGISATYSRSGWGGRKADGRTGWSMRGMFAPLPERENPLHELTPIGTYAYHADMKDDYGDAWMWNGGGHGLLARDRWYCVEQQVKVNRPGQRDGILRAWIDGRLVFERTDVRVRDTPNLRIEQVWMNVYHGGLTPAPTDMHLYIDNVVIAREYIGPLGQKTDTGGVR